MHRLRNVSGCLSACSIQDELKARNNSESRCLYGMRCLLYELTANAISVQSGVGCAAAVINSMLGRNDGECCCGHVDTEGKAARDKGCC